MLIFHEGLPRSGKSYAAMKDHVIPALKAGRKVFARIDGLNFEKIAELAGISEECCRELLHELTPEQTKEIWRHVGKVAGVKDALVIIDELQNYWPTGRQKLGEDITRFVAEHGHDGLDIVYMGQDMRDCHTLWRRRTQRKIVFTKRTAIGKPDSYLWVAYEATVPEKFEKISSGTADYDPAYFGVYASHTDGTSNFAALADDRIVIWKQKSFRLWLPIFVCVVVFAIAYLWKFFHGSGPVKQPTKEVPKVEQGEQKALAQAQPVEPPKPKALDYFDEAAGSYQLRLSLWIPERGLVVVEVMDGDKVLSSFEASELAALGWVILPKQWGVELVKGEVHHLARAYEVKAWDAEVVALGVKVQQ